MSDRFDPERPTQVVCPTLVCPACNGAGYVVEYVSATQHRGSVCACCTGTGIVTVQRMREWRLAHAIQPR